MGCVLPSSKEPFPTDPVSCHPPGAEEEVSVLLYDPLESGGTLASSLPFLFPFLELFTIFKDLT